MSNTATENSEKALSGAINLLSSADGGAEQDTGNAPITLDIAEVSMVKKLIEQERLRYGKLTGNPILDFFYRVNDWLISHSKVTVKDLAGFFRLLAVMINAGVPLIKSLETLSAQSAQNPKLARVISEISQKIEQGQSLSDAMSLYKDVFDDSQIGMTKSGEATGQLNQVLTGLADRLEKNASIAAKVKGALIYPVVILSLLVTVVFVMMIVVVPKMTEFFTQSGKELPFATKILIGMSEFFQSYWVFMAIAGVGIFMTISAWKKTVMGRYQWDGMLLKIPMFGALIRKSLLARFARLLSDLLDSGVQVVQSLHIIADAIGNDVYRQRLVLAAQDVEQGIPLAESLNDPSLFPAVLINMIEIGEQTAHLDVVSEKVAALYDDEVDAMIQGMTKAFEPILLIMIGAVVGGMVAAIMLPIMDMSNVAGA